MKLISNSTQFKTAFFFALSFVITFPLFALVSLEGEYVSPDERAKQEAATAAKSLSDGRASVDEVEGKAFLTKSGNPIQVRLKEGDVIAAGDSVYTEKGASLTISFDDEKLNVIKIPAENKAVFVSIEPTDIRLEDGSIFSAVDGLAEGSSWKVSTPAAVVAVRGTTFEVSYAADSGEFDAVTFEDEKTDKFSAVEIQSLQGGEAVRVVEGKQLSFVRGQAPRMDLVRAVAPDRAGRGTQMREKVQAQRERNKQVREERRKKLDEAVAQGNPPNGPGGPNQPGDSNGINKSGPGFELRNRDGERLPSYQMNREEGQSLNSLKVEKGEEQKTGPGLMPTILGEGSSSLIRRKPIPQSERSVPDLPLGASRGAKVQEMLNEPINKQPQPIESSNGFVPRAQNKSNLVRENSQVAQKNTAKLPVLPAPKPAPAKRN